MAYISFIMLSFDRRLIKLFAWSHLLRCVLYWLTLWLRWCRMVDGSRCHGKFKTFFNKTGYLDNVKVLTWCSHAIVVLSALIPFFLLVPWIVHFTFVCVLMFFLIVPVFSCIWFVSFIRVTPLYTSPGVEVFCMNSKFDESLFSSLSSSSLVSSLILELSPTCENFKFFGRAYFTERHTVPLI